MALSNRPFKSTFISSPEMLVIKIGVKMTPVTVEIKVIVTEKATFKLDKYAITFDAVPPGPVSYTHLTLPTSDLV